MRAAEDASEALRRLRLVISFEGILNLTMRLGTILTILSLAAVCAPLSAQQDPGPAVGAQVPAFQLTDQTGRAQNLETLMGPKGLYLLFVRSADW